MPNAWVSQLPHAMKTKTYPSSAPRVIRKAAVRQKGILLTMCVRHSDSMATIVGRLNPYKGFYGTDKTPVYKSPAKVRGSTQLIPRSKFLSNDVAILNFHLEDFHLDTGNLGKILEPFASAFFPKEGNGLIYNDIVFDLTQSRCRHTNQIHDVIRKITAARFVPQAGTGCSEFLPCPLSSTLKTVIILIKTHAANDTGYLATSSSCSIDFNNVCSFLLVFEPIS
jgi:hypothetical protein